MTDRTIVQRRTPSGTGWEVWEMVSSGHGEWFLGALYRDEEDWWQWADSPSPRYRTRAEAIAAWPAPQP